jgi:type IV pilus assembly protein PilQ
MTLSRTVALLGLAIAGALVSAPHARVQAAGAVVQLKSISSRVHEGGASLTIEASEPVAYVTTRPDPLTVVLDFRNVDAQALATRLTDVPGSPIARVMVEPAASDIAVTRVRVALTQPVPHRVRSERTTVVVEFDRPSERSLPVVLPPASRQADPLQVLARLDAAAQPTAPAAAPAAPPTRIGTAGPITPSQADQGARGGTRTYVGDPVTLDFQGADLRAVLRTFSEISSLNMVIDPAVTGTVDVALRDVPWDQALDQILRANRLGYLIDGTIVRIAPLTVLADEEAQRRKLAEEQALAGELHVVTHALSYARADAMVTLLEESVLSQRGSVQVDERTNTLIVTDLQDRLDTVRQLLTTLDTPQPQVEIEARIVQTNKDYARALGIEWGFTGRVDPALGNTTTLAFPNSGTLTANTNFPPDQVPASAVGLTLGSVNGAFNLDLALSALESSGNGRLLSTPRISTQNNVPAEITQGTQIPIQTVANNTVTVQFQDAALTLRVTPQITAANTVIMRIELENAEPDFGRSVNGIPPIDTQRANTTVLVRDGETTVIGGINLSREAVTSDRTPGLSRIPLLNWFFKRDNVSERSTELLIFITPRISRG